MDSNGPGGAPAPPGPFRPPASRIRVSEKPFGRTIFFDAAPIVFVKKSSKSEASSRFSCLGTTHCPRWKPHIVLFGKHTLSCLESTHCPVWKAHILLSGEHRFSCLESTHSLVWKAHILVFRKHTFSCLESTTPGMTVFRTPVSAKRVAGGGPGVAGAPV